MQVYLTAVQARRVLSFLKVCLRMLHTGIVMTISVVYSLPGIQCSGGRVKWCESFQLLVCMWLLVGVCACGRGCFSVCLSACVYVCTVDTYQCMHASIYV